MHTTTGWVIQYLQELGAMYLHSSCKYCPAVCAPSQIERLNRDTRPALALADKTSRKLLGGNFSLVKIVQSLIFRSKTLARAIWVPF